MYWQCLPLPQPPSPLSIKVGDGIQPNPAAESDDAIFFLSAYLAKLITDAGIFGDEDIDKWFQLLPTHQCQISENMSRKTICCCLCICDHGLWSLPGLRRMCLTLQTWTLCHHNTCHLILAR